MLRNKRLEQAARWLARSKDKDFSPDDRKMLTAWLEEDPANRSAFEEIGGIWAQVGAVEHLFAAENENECRDGLVAGSGLEQPKIGKGLPFLSGIFAGNMRLAAAGIAVALLILLCLPMIKGRSSEPKGSVTTYTTAKGEQKSVTLRDGSVLEMNVGSEISVYMSDALRRVEMSEGEVFFEVSRNPARPFEVILPTGRVRVLGTGFNVKSRAGNVAVDVEYGRVRVEDNPISPREAHNKNIILTAEQGVDITPSGRLTNLRPSRIKQVLAWQRGQMVFENTPVGQVLDELALYHHVKIRLVADGLEEKGITGTFDMRDLDRTLSIIALATSLTIEQEIDGTIKLYGGTVVGDR